MPLVIDNTCCRALVYESACEHKKGYLETEAYVKSEGIIVGYAPDVVSGDAWKVGRSHPGKQPSITIWPTAYQIFGWEIVTSVLIHEYGHCKLYEVERCCDDTIDCERKANEYGRRFLPRRLIPPDYDEHRRFFLQSYEKPGALTTREQVLQAIQDWC
jgi:hypothetical protein